MHSLLTGKFGSAEQPTDEPWTAEDHLAAMRRLLHTASQSPSSDTERIMTAARIHAEAAKSAPRTQLPVKTAPARTAPYGDTI